MKKISFNILIRGEEGDLVTKGMQGYKDEIMGIPVTLHRESTKNGWILSDYATGLMIIDESYGSRETMLYTATNLLEKNKITPQKWRERIEDNQIINF